MGRFSEPLAERFAEAAQVRPGDRALDVGVRAGRTDRAAGGTAGASAVSAIDPSAAVRRAVHERFPEVDVRTGAAEDLPFPDDGFDRPLPSWSCTSWPTRWRGCGRWPGHPPGGLVTACVWDHAGDSGPLATFWRAVHDLDPGAPGEAGLAGAREGHLAELCEAAGLADRVHVADGPVGSRRSTTGGNRSRWVSGRRARTSSLDDAPRECSGPMCRAAAVAAVRDRGVGLVCGCSRLALIPCHRHATRLVSRGHSSTWSRSAPT